MTKTAPGRDVASLNACYLALLGLCDQLEAIADGLPDRFGAERSRLVADQLSAVLARTHAEEERVLLPLMSISAHPQLHSLAKRLRREHQVDEAAALDLRETLLALASGRPLFSAEATGYQLRSFFESVRRHVRAEQDLLFLLGKFNSGPEIQT